MRERSTLKALHMLMQKALVGQEDFSVLSDNYGRLRVLEHRLQQLNDLQTHTLPSGGRDLDILGRKLGFADAAGFMSDLEQRRASVRRIYDSLFGEEAKKTEGETGFFDEELSDTELREHLSTTGLKDINRAVRNIREIKDSSLTFQTLKGRRLLSGILPLFVDSALKTGAPDEALSQLQSFAKLLGANESYLEIFSRDRRMIDMLTAVFAQTAYLSRFLISRPQYLEMIGWQERPDKTLSKIKDEISAIMSEGRSVNEAVRFIKQAEEVRLGLLFLQGELPVGNVTRGLSRVAHAVLSVCLGHLRPDVGGLAIIGLGKLGGREITFGSDLDIVFISGDGVGTEDTLAAERLLRILTSYTKDGMAYKIDTRLRPEGSKGPLVSSIDGFRSYYLQSALFWELQALLKARPVAGSEKAGLAFMSMAHEVLMTRGREVMASDIRRMRERIMRELSKEAMGYDIKLSSGGLEELEFIIQFLQLRHCRQHPSILVQNTLKAIDRLRKTAIVSALDAEDMRRAYIFYRTVESLLRLRGEDVLRRDETSLKNMAGLLGAGGPEELISMIDKSRQGVTEAGERYLRDP